MPASMPTEPPGPDETPAGRGAPRRRRPLLTTLCAVPVALLLAVACLAPLPYAVTRPDLTADVLGDHDGRPVIGISGAPVRDTEGRLLLTTISATAPDATVRLGDVVSAYLAGDRAVMPRDAVHPDGDSTEEIRAHNAEQMRASQDAAITAALDHLGRDPADVTVEVNLADVGGPSGGLLLALGIVDLLAGDGHGGDLTGGATIAGTGTIDADGTVGPVGGTPLKIQAAHRDGATVFLVPREDCGDATANRPEGMRLLPVTTLAGAVEDLRALAAGEPVPSC
jgi:PDZ domain-containing protein